MNKDDLMKCIAGILGMVAIVCVSVLLGTVSATFYNNFTSENNSPIEEINIHTFKDNSRVYPRFGKKIIMKECLYRRKEGYFHKDVDCEYLTRQIKFEIYHDSFQGWPTKEQFEERMRKAISKFYRRWLDEDSPYAF